MPNAYAPVSVQLSGTITEPVGGEPRTVASVTAMTRKIVDAVKFADGAVVTEAARAAAAESALQPGRFIRTTVLTSAAANHTTHADARTCKIRGVGGGGGGGGCTSVGGAAGAAGGGAAGGYCEKTFTCAGATAYAYTCGAAGTGNSGAGGNAGGNSTFDANGVTVTAGGGPAAQGAVSSAAVTVTPGGNVSAATNGDVNVPGANGDPGFVTLVASPIGWGGKGGSGPFGAGAQGITAVGNGATASGHGAGGGGSLTGASAARTGGTGTAGMWVVDEYT